MGNTDRGRDADGEFWRGLLVGIAGRECWWGGPVGRVLERKVLERGVLVGRVPVGGGGGKTGVEVRVGGEDYWW